VLLLAPQTEIEAIADIGERGVGGAVWTLLSRCVIGVGLGIAMDSYSFVDHTQAPDAMDVTSERLRREHIGHGYKRVEVAVDGRRVICETAGTGSPTVVINAGTVWNATSLVAQIAQYTSVVSYTHAGLLKVRRCYPLCRCERSRTCT
jgi:hypothetical protein